MFPRTTIHQSAAIPVRRGSPGYEILLITSRSKRRWIVPKGVVAEGLSAEDSAVKEAYEEAGVSGTILHASVCHHRFTRRGVRYHIDVYPMAVTEEHPEWPEMGFRRRRWISVDDLPRIRLEERLRACLADAIIRLTQHTNP